jgi:hypothetical protein
MRGALPGGLEGTLALFTYEETHRDSDGDRQTTYYHFTVVLADVPESAVHARELYCQRRVGFSLPRLGRGRISHARADHARERGARPALRDLRRPRRGPQLDPPAL